MNDVLEALKGTPKPPCDVSPCIFRPTCRDNKSACNSFLLYVIHGREVTRPHHDVPTRYVYDVTMRLQVDEKNYPRNVRKLLKEIADKV